MKLSTVFSVLALAASGFALPSVFPEEVADDRVLYNSAGTQFTSCGSDSDILKIKEIVLSPDPPKGGKALTITATGTNSAVVSPGAEVAVTAKVGFLTVLSTTLDLCSYAGEVGYPCPVAPGDMTVKFSVDIPSNVPKLGVNVKAVAKNADGAQLFCMSGKVQLTRDDWLPIREMN